MGEDGKPVYDQEQVYDQQFFLSLARRGRDAWNKWQDENPGVRVIFEEVDFREPANATINFSGFNFGGSGHGGANLSGAIFGDWTDLSGAAFSYATNLSGAVFGYGTNLSCATFRGVTNFPRATFGDHVDLSGVAFEYGPNFSGATFGSEANLSGATFGSAVAAKFTKATFGNGANLSGASFGNEADFSDAIFEGSVDLSAQSKDDWREKISKLPAVSETMRSWPQERQQQFWEGHQKVHQTGAGPDVFRRISFARARFRGIADFSGRNFSARCDLTGAWFDQPPEFHDCEATGHIDFYGIRFFRERSQVAGRTTDNNEMIRLRGLRKLADEIAKFFRERSKSAGWTTNSDVAIRLRAFRKLADETGNHDLERDLYIEERKAERGIALAEYWREGKTALLLAHCLWIAVMGIYWLLADYGRSVIRPLLVLVLSIFVFHASYSMLLTSPSTSNEVNLKRAVWAFTIANAVPFVGTLTLEKEVKGLILCAAAPPEPVEMEDSTPTCAPVPTVTFQLLVLGQSIISGLLVFFIALALRNYFKLR
jgi:uncharacterized protein YjbI with pentapeptide repeats